MRGRSLYVQATKRPMLTALALLGAGLAAGAALRSRGGAARRKADSWQPQAQPVPERHSTVRATPPAARPPGERPMPENTPKQPAEAFQSGAPRHTGPQSRPVATTSPTGVSHF